MKYRKFIEDKFLIDRPDGKLVPFIFNKVQNKYYDDLCKEYDIENKGIAQSIRENILKARREGFSSLILALFAADDLMQDNPTETAVLSYKDEATKTFRRRYRTYVLSYLATKLDIEPYTKEEIIKNISILDKVAKKVLAVDSTDIILAHNRAHFYCGTASAKVGGRGGVLQKLLFSEIAFYPDTEKVAAAEMIEATMRQVDIAGGWIFAESTENGSGTYQYKLWIESKRGRSRFKNRFYGWDMFYTEEEYAQISSEYIDLEALRRDYPRTEDDLFKGSANSFTNESDLESLINLKTSNRELIYWLELPGINYIDQCEILANMLETLEREHQGHALYAGIDVAKDRDASVLWVMKDRRRDLTGGVKGIAIDSTGAGDFMPDWFTRNTRWYIVEVKFSRSSKDIMYKNLQVVIAEGLTSLPILKLQNGQFVSKESEHFWKQMIELEKETIGNLLVVSHPPDSNKHDEYGEGAHDDYPDAWTLAEHVYVLLNGREARKKAPTIPTVPHAVDNLLSNSMRNRRGSGANSSFE